MYHSFNLPDIIYSRSYYCYQLTNEKTDMQGRFCQEHTANKKQCWDLIPDLWLQLLLVSSQVSDKDRR